MQPFWVLPYALRHRAGRLAHEAQVASSCCCISSCRAVCPFHFFFEALCSIFACPLSGRVPDFFFGLGFNRAMCRFLFAFGLCYWHVILLPRPSFARHMCIVWPCCWLFLRSRMFICPLATCVVNLFAFAVSHGT